MRVVLDTNVIVSGFLNPYGPPGLLVQMASDGALTLCFDARLLAEYREVLLRPHLGLSESAVEDFVAQVREEGHLVTASPLPERLPDPDDEAFLEVALAGRADCLVTGNLRDFPAGRRHGMSVLSPAELVERLRSD